MMLGPDSCFEYHLSLPEKAWFYQMPGENQVYWLSIAAQYPPGMQPENPWGWKTRPHFFNDDAVRIFDPVDPGSGSEWKDGEPIVRDEKSWDLAFVLTTPPYDLGDASDTYRTLFASGGGRAPADSPGTFHGSAGGPRSRWPA